MKAHRLSQTCIDEIKRLGARTGSRAYSDQQIADYLFAHGFTNRVIHWTTVNNHRVREVGYRYDGWKKIALERAKRAKEAEKAAQEAAKRAEPVLVTVSAPEPVNVAPEAPQTPAPAPAQAAPAAASIDDRLDRLERVLARMVELQLRSIKA